MSHSFPPASTATGSAASHTYTCKNAYQAAGNVRDLNSGAEITYNDWLKSGTGCVQEIVVPPFGQVADAFDSTNVACICTTDYCNRASATMIGFGRSTGSQLDWVFAVTLIIAVLVAAMTR